MSSFITRLRLFGKKRGDNSHVKSFVCPELPKKGRGSSENQIILIPEFLFGERHPYACRGKKGNIVYFREGQDNYEIFRKIFGGGELILSGRPNRGKLWNRGKNSFDYGLQGGKRCVNDGPGHTSKLRRRGKKRGEGCRLALLRGKEELRAKPGFTNRNSKGEL